LILMFSLLCTAGFAQDKAFVTIPKTTILYEGIPQYVKIELPRFSCDSISVQVSNGTIEGSGCDFLITPEKTGTVQLLIEGTKEGKVVKMEERLVVGNLPTPEAFFAGKCSMDNTVIKMEAVNYPGVRAAYPNFNYDINARVTSFELIILQNGQIMHRSTSNSNKITAPMKIALKKIKKGDEILISNIKSKTPQGEDQSIAPIFLKVI